MPHLGHETSKYTNRCHILWSIPVLYLTLVFIAVTCSQIFFFSTYEIECEGYLQGMLSGTFSYTLYTATLEVGNWKDE